MNRRRKYRIVILGAFCIDLFSLFMLGYRYIDKKIPDHIYVTRGEESGVTELLENPFVEFENAIPVAGEGSYVLPCKVLGMIPFKDVKVTPQAEKEIAVSGSTVGIYLETEGVLAINTGKIVSCEGKCKEPSRNIIKPGDYIVALNDKAISSKKELINEVRNLAGDDKVTIDLIREGEKKRASVHPVKDTKGVYKLGIWVRDDTQGIGTLTFVDDEGHYGALGHGISDIDTAKLLKINKGSLYKAQILSVVKGDKGSPGELAGLIRYEPGGILGSIDINSKNGIFGNYRQTPGDGITLRRIPVAYKQEAKIAPATILSCVDGQVREYSAEITHIDLNHEDTNKSFVIHVTDEELLQKTGGIVQGMSGSPILQNGKIVGAVTHVLVNDPTRGYGIFIENMLEQ